MSIVRLVRVCLALGVVGTAIALYLVYSLFQTRSATFSAAESAAYQAAADAAREIDSELKRVESIANTLARQLSATKLSEEELNARLLELMRDNPEFQSVGLAYAPYSFDPKRRLYAPALMRDGESFKSHRIEEAHDYTKGGLQWYADAIKDGPTWAEPVWQEAENAVIVIFSTPLYGTSDDGQRKVTGAAYASISLERITASVAELDVGRTGWGFVVSKDGYVIVHPNKRVVQERTNILEIAEADNDEAIRVAAERATAGESGTIEAINHTTGQSSWFVYQPIAVTGWSMVVVRIKDEIQIEPQFVRRGVIWASVSAILGLTCLAIWFGAGWYKRRPKRAILWGIVVFSSALLASGMAAIRHVTYSQVAEDPRESVEIVDQTGLQSFLKSQAMAVNAGPAQTLRYIPSGVFVRSMKFVNPKEVFVKGLLWQKLDDEMSEGFSPGFALPDAVELNMSKAYRQRNGASETIGWEFQATLRQNMDLSRFPFDHDSVSIRLLPKDFTGGAVLVPDLSSYSVINPSSLPGLDENLELSGWHLSRSFFDYKISSYQTNFGLSQSSAQTQLPELHFNISVQRNLVDAAVSYGIPLVVVLAMLFAIVAAATKDQSESELADFSPSAVMKICSALFFVVLLAHIQLRQTIQVPEIVFLEYIYFTVYLALLLTSLHTFLFLLKRFSIPVVEYENSLIIKLLFWPALLGLQFAVTAVFFY